VFKNYRRKLEKKLKLLLAKSQNEMFDNEGTRSFKSLEAVKNFEEVYVQKYIFLLIENNFQKHAGVMALIAKTV
jgi:hypothetical protein